MYLIIGIIKPSKISCKISTPKLCFYIPPEENCACYKDETKIPCYMSYTAIVLAQKCENVIVLS